MPSSHYLGVVAHHWRARERWDAVLCAVAGVNPRSSPIAGSARCLSMYMLQATGCNPATNFSLIFTSSLQIDSPRWRQLISLTEASRRTKRTTLVSRVALRNICLQPYISIHLLTSGMKSEVSNRKRRTYFTHSDITQSLAWRNFTSVCFVNLSMS